MNEWMDRKRGNEWKMGKEMDGEIMDKLEEKKNV